MNRYNSYKNTGVEWVGEIPSKWEWIKIKNLFSFSKGNGISKSDIEEDGLSKCILYGELFTRFKNFNVIPNEFSKTNLEDKIVSEGDELLIPGSTTTTSVDLCNCKTLKYKGIQLGGDIIILKPRRTDIYNEFYSYYISTVTKPDFETGGRGVTIHHIYPKQIREIQIPYLPLSEQQQIVSFLDTKTSLIDSLIEKTHQKIELLKEKRTSLINELVTKGLNPNVEMKESGEEWIGEIPSHWSKTKISRFCEVKDGTHDTPNYIDISEESIPLVTSNSFVNGEIDFSKSKRISTQDYIEINKRSDVKLNDVIMSMIGSNIGNRVLVQTEKPFSIKNVCLFKTSNSQNLNSKYLIYLIDSKYLKYQVDFNQKGGGQPFLSLDELRSLLFPFPPLSEQLEIVSYLDEQTQKIDKTISIEEKRIELLKEYRQSLISEVVTGKLKVTTDE